MKRLKVFLASSGEMKQERKEIALLIAKHNNTWTSNKDTYIELVVWEDLLHSFKGERIQDYFNEEMLKCDIVIALFFKKVGEFTKEEFDKAYENLKKDKKPHYLFVFFKKTNIPIDEIDAEILKIRDLKKEIREYEQIYCEFDSDDNLKLKLLNQLETIISSDQTAIVPREDISEEAKAKQDLENYWSHLTQQFRYLDFTGLRAILQKPLSLEDIYVKLKTNEFVKYNTNKSPLQLSALAFTSNFWPLSERKTPFSNLSQKNNDGCNIYTKSKEFSPLFQQLFEEKKEKGQPLKMFILGHPGSGKTTMMKWTALQCLKKNVNNIFNQWVPMFLSLKELGSSLKETFQEKSIRDVFFAVFNRVNISIESFWEIYFRQGKLLFLLDGLDEIGDEKIRWKAMTWIQEQYLGQNSLIVTSRFSAVKEEKGLKFREDIPVFEIQDFEMADVEIFLENWYQNIEIAVTGEIGIQQAVETAKEKSNNLIDIIKDDHNKRLRELAVNPLLLTIIAIVHRTRHILPRDRYRLYEECLRVMIELWHFANKKLDVNFSFDNSMSYLSKIAVSLMESEQREMSKEEILNYLPPTIEGKSRDFFLNDMVVKAGLLFESEGKYGFLHLTFQEYLVAWYYASGSHQNRILHHLGKDYWQETFRLLMNVGNARLFFLEIISNLMQKKYWKHLYFLESLISEIVVEEAREQVEISYVTAIIKILYELDYSDKNDEILNKMYSITLIYKHAQQFIEKGWQLFHHAPHPFVQSIGASILLNSNDDETLIQLTAQLKHRILDYEKQKKISPEATLHFFMQNNNKLLILLWGRHNLLDFSDGLQLMTIQNSSLQFLGIKTIWDFVGFLCIPDSSPIPDILYVPDILDFLGIIETIDTWGTQSTRDSLDFLNSQNFMDIQSLYGIDYLKYIKKTLDHYYSEYRSIILNHQKDILDWVENAFKKLKSLSNKELLKYFPNTTEAEFREFREKY